MKTYEVHVPLENGHTLNILMASPDKATAIGEVHGALRGAFRAVGPRSVAAANWRFDDITAEVVEVFPEGACSKAA